MLPHPGSALRNRGPIVEKFKEIFPGGSLKGKVLEIASGTGAHLEVMHKEWPDVMWCPTEYDAEKVGVLKEVYKGVENVERARRIDASKAFGEWGMEPGVFSLMYCANVTHISPWGVTQGIIKGAAAALHPTGTLLIYGPFKVNHECTTESNAAFDASLRSQDPSWGYRDISELEVEAKASGMTLVEASPMPANNFMLRFARA